MTGADGTISLPEMASGCYEITETSVPSPYILDVNNRQTVWIDAEKDQDVTVDFVNSTKPGLRLVKTDFETGKPIAGVTFLIEQIGGSYSEQLKTDQNGEIFVENLTPGAYKVTELDAPGYVVDSTPHTVALELNRTTTLELTNVKRPTLKIAKVDINGTPLTGAIFEVKTKSGVKIGDFPVGEDGTVTISNTQLDEGYYIVTEKQAPTGYILDSTPHEVYLRPGKTTEITMENEKKPGLTNNFIALADKQIIVYCRLFLRLLHFFLYRRRFL